MLGVRLKPEEEDRLTRHARGLGRSKSAIVREWIVERLERDDVDEQIRCAAALHATSWTDDEKRRADANTDDHLRDLDEEDGGYDWGLAGPPSAR